jgi:hypothetical protein
MTILNIKIKISIVKDKNGTSRSHFSTSRSTYYALINKTSTCSSAPYLRPAIGC